ncbi:MAG: hypothetical protein NPIRA05_14630 [Nitrospirales bacterium]|nr:MAG: hypothetical protein NPIRA05_14630 [Nitrospirales bacterium]
MAPPNSERVGGYIWNLAHVDADRRQGSLDPDPLDRSDTLLEFLQIMYEAAANLIKWDRASLEPRIDPKITGA